MLDLVFHMKDLDFSSLMDIYEEGNRENGDELYPDYSPEGRLRLAEQDFHRYLAESFFGTEGAFYALWRVQNESVSALRLEPYRDGWLLEALETKPSKRSSGYAKALLQAVLAYMRHGAFLPIYSHIRKGNAASETVHRICGFSVWKDLAVYIDGSVDHRCNTWIYK